MALRTVGVKLTADVRAYTASIEKSSKDTKGLATQLNETAKAGDKTAAAVVVAGKSARQMADEFKASGRAGVAAFTLSERAAERLDEQIEETARGIRDLEREFAKTGDLKLFKDLSRQMGVLKRQLKAKDMFSPEVAAQAGAEMAGEVSLSFAARLGPLIARAPMAGMNPAVLAVAAPFAVGAASVVGASVAGAVVGAAGAGGVAGGLMLAAKDGRVKDAGTKLGADLGAMLTRSSAVFVPTTLKTIDQIRARALALEPALKRAFLGAANLVQPLVDGAFRGVENFLPGLIRAIERAEPVIDSIANGLADMGDAVGDVFSDLADDADAGARAFQLLFLLIEGGIRTVGKLVEALAWVFEKLDKYGGALWQVATDSDRLNDSSKSTALSISDLGSESMTTAERLQAVKDAFDELFGVQMDADRALIAYHQGLRDLNEELGKGKKTLSVNSEEGIRNRSAVLDQVDAIKQLRDSRIAEGMSITEADGKYQSHLGSLRKTLLAAGYAKSEVDELIGSYRAIPKKVDTTVRANTTPAMTAAAKLRQYLRNIPDEHVNIAMRVTGTRNASAAAAAIRKQYANRWGGLYHAETGLLREANLWGSGDTMYAFREPATGGEAFIPKNGDDRRSRAIWEYVGENWLGARPAQPVVASAGAQRMQFDVRLAAGDGSGPMQELVRAMMPHLRIEVVNRYGGKVDRALVTG